MKVLRITAAALWALVFLVLGVAANVVSGGDGPAGFILGMIGGGGAYLIATDWGRGW
jgi:hypothetical protein